MRLRRAYGWSGAAFLVYGTTFVFVLFAAVGGSIRPTAVGWAAAVLAIASLVLLFWRERRAPAARRPASWVPRSLAIALPHAIAFGVAAAGVLDRTVPPSWERVVLLGCAPLAIELVAIGIASRALRRPLTADLGEMDVEIVVKIRSPAEWLPGWLSHHDVTLTDDSVIITVRLDSKWKFVLRIALIDVVEVDIRRTTTQDGPWFVTDDGRPIWSPPGDLVAIKHRRGIQLLPVHDPVGFADVLRARIRTRATTGGEDEPRG
jgi:hypothetical protein